MIKKIGYFFILLILIALGGSGWFFSGVIYEGALNPEFNDSQNIGTAEDRVIVLEVSNNSITLNIEEELWGPLLEKGVYGIIGQNGDAVIGKIMSTEGTVVKRELISLNGTIVEGDRIRGTSLVVRDENNEYKILGTSGWSGQASEGVYTPKSVSNLDYETIYYESNLGKFPAYLTNDGDVGIVIFVHGFRGDYSREVFAKMRAGEIVDMGYRSMIISYRNDKGLPKDPSGIFQYGTTEWQDIDAAINKALEFTDNVVLFGTSGGGGPISSWLENVGDENKVKGIIYEAPVINFWKSVEVNGAARYPWVPKQLFGYFKIVTEIRYGVDFQKMDFTEAVINSNIPVLLFHGDDDEWVPVEMSDLIAESRVNNLTYIRYENVGHVTSWNADPDNYIYQLKTFLTNLD
jgi:pimeloyl-ACP methyl ester carboxylesterase